MTIVLIAYGITALTASGALLGIGILRASRRGNLGPSEQPTVARYTNRAA